MIATVLLCVLSTISFCLSVRGLFAVVAAGRRAHRSWSSYGGTESAFDIGRREFSMSARRLARFYAAVAFFLLAGLSLAGVCNSYLELFGVL